VPDFSKLTKSEVTAFAETTAALVCGDDNVDGMAWDVEPFDSDQVEFFAALDTAVTKCGKRWGVFAFGEDLTEDMWTRGLGKSGFLFDSAYDLDCSKSVLPTLGCQPCQCTPPPVYKAILEDHLKNVTALAKRYGKPYRLMVSGSGSTQLFESLSTAYCSGAGGGPAYDTTCTYTMEDWMTVTVDAMEEANVRGDPRFEGLGVRGKMSIGRIGHE
jgi:hypothetical protein